MSALFPYFCVGSIPFAVRAVSSAPTTTVLVASAAVYVSGTAVALGAMVLNNEHERKARLVDQEEQMTKLRYRESTFEKLASRGEVTRYTEFSNTYRSKV